MNKLKETKITIREIAERTAKTSPYFFSSDTLSFFGQRMTSFKVSKHKQDGVQGWKISAPSYWKDNSAGKPNKLILMGYTERFFNPITDDLEDLKSEDLNNE